MKIQIVMTNELWAGEIDVLRMIMKCVDYRRKGHKEC